MTRAEKLSFLIISNVDEFIVEFSKDWRKTTVRTMTQIKNEIELNIKYLNYQKITKLLNKYINIDESSLKKYHTTYLYIITREKEYNKTNENINIEFLKYICEDKSYYDFNILCRFLSEDNIKEYLDKLHEMFKDEISIFHSINMKKMNRIKKLENVIS